MSDDLSIRPFRPDDADRVRELHETALRAAGGYVDLGDESAEEDLLDVEGAYFQSGGEFLVGVLDGEIVAMGAFRRVGGYLATLLDADDSTAEVKRVRVDPAHWREGYGQRIFDELETSARERGYAELVLDTTPAQTGARRFFEANGFSLVRRERIDAFEEPFELLVYRKRIDG